MIWTDRGQLGNTGLSTLLKTEISLISPPNIKFRSLVRTN